MTSRDVLRKFLNVRIGYSSKGRRAPHKPLLLIWTINRCLSGESRLAPFRLVKVELERLMELFGPHSGKRNVHVPFWRLRTDGIWELDRPHLVKQHANGGPQRSSLLANNIHGGLREDYYDRLSADPALAFEIVMSLLDEHFPETLHQDILEAVGMTNTLGGLGSEPDRYGLVKLRQGQAAFRESVLDAYEHCCAVCGLAIRVHGALVAIEAAHIRWHTSKGPAEVRNGLALCALHHKFFDYGAFTVLSDFKVYISSATEGRGVDEALRDHHGRLLFRIPDHADERPGEGYLEWHHKEVFKTPRELSRAGF